MKWQELSYSECTWETTETLASSQEEIARYESEVPIMQDSKIRYAIDSSDGQSGLNSKKRTRRGDAKKEASCVHTYS